MVLVLTLNFPWEMAQMPLYATRMTIGRCLAATGVDVTGIAFAFAAGVARDRRWALWTTLVLLLVDTAAVIERLALSAGRWSYAAAMPALGGVGLAPLAQLPLIAGASSWLAGRTWVARGTERRGAPRRSALQSGERRARVPAGPQSARSSPATTRVERLEERLDG